MISKTVNNSSMDVDNLQKEEGGEEEEEMMMIREGGRTPPPTPTGGGGGDGSNEQAPPRKRIPLRASAHITNEMMAIRLNELRGVKDYQHFVFSNPFPIVLVTIPESFNNYAMLSEGRFKPSGLIPSIFLLEFLYVLRSLIDEEFDDFLEGKEKILEDDTEDLELKDRFKKLKTNAYSSFSEDMCKIMNECQVFSQTLQASFRLPRKKVEMDTSLRVFSNQLTRSYQEIVICHEVLFGKLCFFRTILQLSAAENILSTMDRLEFLSERSSLELDKWMANEHFENFISPRGCNRVVLDEHVQDNKDLVDYVKAVRFTVRESLHKTTLGEEEEKKKKKKKNESMITIEEEEEEL